LSVRILMADKDHKPVPAQFRQMFPEIGAALGVHP
jgi:hypothetical protein